MYAQYAIILKNSNIQENKQVNKKTQESGEYQETEGEMNLFQFQNNIKEDQKQKD
jgi:hypothetical protein